MYLPTGTIICCNHCHRALLKLKHDVDEGERIMADDFEAIPPHPQPENETLAICSYCGENHNFTEWKPPTTM